MYFSHFLSSLPWFSLFSFRTLRARYASLPLRVKSGGSYTHELWASSAKMKSCRRCDFTHYLFSFPPWETLNLHDLNNSIKACHHTHRLSWILSVYPKKRMKKWMYVMIFSCLIAHSSPRLSSCTVISLGTDMFTCSFIFALKFITPDYETFNGKITFLLTRCLSYHCT